MSRFILLTGATGNLGSKLAANLLKDSMIDRLVLLVRGANADHARWRALRIIEETAQGLLPHDWPNRVIVLAGDMTQEQMGLSSKHYDELIHRVTHIIHSAAVTSFVQSRHASLKNNFNGTVNVMRLARLCHLLGRLESIGYVSTAYVNGPSDNLIQENMLAPRSHFFNSYELSKWAAERFIRSMMKTLPVMIFRPSIVLGDSRTGYTCSFNAAYQPIKQICSDQERLLPGAGETLLDMVPVDYVAAAILYIFNRPSNAGRCFHIVSGQENSISCNSFVQTMRAYLQSRGLCTGTVRFEYDWGLSDLAGIRPLGTRAANRILQIFTPYMSNSWKFDDSNTRLALRSTDIKCQHPKTYLDTILDFCLGTNWGKRIKKTA